MPVVYWPHPFCWLASIVLMHSRSNIIGDVLYTYTSHKHNATLVLWSDTMPGCRILFCGSRLRLSHSLWNKNMRCSENGWKMMTVRLIIKYYYCIFFSFTWMLFFIPRVYFYMSQSTTVWKRFNKGSRCVILTTVDLGIFSPSKNFCLWHYATKIKYTKIFSQ